MDLGVHNYCLEGKGPQYCSGLARVSRFGSGPSGLMTFRHAQDPGMLLTRVHGQANAEPGPTLAIRATRLEPASTARLAAVCRSPWARPMTVEPRSVLVATTYALSKTTSLRSRAAAARVSVVVRTMAGLLARQSGACQLQQPSYGPVLQTTASGRVAGEWLDCVLMRTQSSHSMS